MPRQIGWEEHNRLRVKITWDGENYCARCLDYEIKATGKTLNEARDALSRMIQQYLALTDVRVWDNYYASVQELMEDEIQEAWSSGEHAVN